MESYIPGDLTLWWNNFSVSLKHTRENFYGHSAELTIGLKKQSFRRCLDDVRFRRVLSGLITLSARAVYSLTF